jgi:hypothetical protein
MLKLWCARWAAKSSCAILQFEALPLQLTRPLTTKSACTPLSGVPSGFTLRPAARIGPFARTNDGTLFLAP